MTESVTVAAVLQRRAAVLGWLVLVAICAAGCATGCAAGCSRSDAPQNKRVAPVKDARLAASNQTGNLAIWGDDALRGRMAKALAAKGKSYEARTRHKNGDGSPKFTNRLIFETSPYLTQHAHNPVAWFPWGDEAFELARKLHRPVFLSVGYATCHWCHVMEEESFEDEEIARYINSHYIPIKVDREERPDVDAIYMQSVQLLTGRGGWPMSVWLTADRKPFYGGTYFPARDGDRGRSRGFLTLLRALKQAFDENPAAVENDAQKLAEQIRAGLKPPLSSSLPGANTLARAAQLAKKNYDETFGGRRGAPKFPSSFPLRLLLRYGLRAGDKAATEMALETLRKMQAGGIYDHVAGGFHRYATDQRWLVPHFEKMLYDNALLTLAYLEGYQVSHDEDLARVARETLDYVAREMTAKGGGYYSATDADSIGPGGEREEGYYFTWTPSELEKTLGAERAKIIVAYYGVTPRGNFEGRNILFSPRSRAAVARSLSIKIETLNRSIADSRELLRQTRSRRAPPLLDDKLQVGWNGLMISAMARGASVLSDESYQKSAERAAKRILEQLVVAGRLHHSTKDGRVSTRAFAEDYAFFAAGLIDLFELSHEPRWLSAAIEMMLLLEKHHGNAADGGYYRTANDHEKLLAREMEIHDGALPSAGSVALLNQLRLSSLTSDDSWRQRAETTVRGYAGVLERRPNALEEMLLAIDYFTDKPKEVMLSIPEGMKRDDASIATMQRVLRRSFLPNHVYVVSEEKRAAPQLHQLVPWAANKPAQGGKPTAYVCEEGSCDLPTNDPKVFAAQLVKAVRPYGGKKGGPLK